MSKISESLKQALEASTKVGVDHVLIPISLISDAVKFMEYLEELVAVQAKALDKQWFPLEEKG